MLIIFSQTFKDNLMKTGIALILLFKLVDSMLLIQSKKCFAVMTHSFENNGGNKYGFLNVAFILFWLFEYVLTS